MRDRCGCIVVKESVLQDTVLQGQGFVEGNKPWAEIQLHARCIILCIYHMRIDKLVCIQRTEEWREDVVGNS